MNHALTSGPLRVELTTDSYEYNDKKFFTLKVLRLEKAEVVENDSVVSGLGMTATDVEVAAYLRAALQATNLAEGVQRPAKAAARAGLAAVDALCAPGRPTGSPRFETMSQFATRADLWEARAKRFAQALVDVLDGVKDHDLPSEIGLAEADCGHIVDAQVDAKLILTPTLTAEADHHAPAGSPRLETMSQFATRADLWEARAKRFAQALVDVLDGVKDHDLPGETGLAEADCQHIVDARVDAQLVLTVDTFCVKGALR